MRLALLLVVAGLAFVAACTGNGADSDEPTGESGADDTATDDDQADQISAGVLASVDFVSAAIEGRDAEERFATDPLSDDQLGAVFDIDLLAARLGELRSFDGTVVEVQPAIEAIVGDGADGDPTPTCGRSSGLFCQVDLIGSGGTAIASVVVYWFGDGVTDFSIVPRGSGGAPIGIGGARCGPGSTLLHGGHTLDRFDIAVCINASGDLEYNGNDRSRDAGIRLEACQDGPTWQAVNEGFQYTVDSSPSAVRSTITVRNPGGAVVEDGRFTAVRIEPDTAPRFC